MLVEDLIELLEEYRGLEMPVYINGGNPKQVRVVTDVIGFCIETDPCKEYITDKDIIIWEDSEDE